MQKDGESELEHIENFKATRELCIHLWLPRVDPMSRSTRRLEWPRQTR
jgi:hypothetical protein